MESTYHSQKWSLFNQIINEYGKCLPFCFNGPVLQKNKHSTENQEEGTFRNSISSSQLNKFWYIVKLKII